MFYIESLGKQTYPINSFQEKINTFKFHVVGVVLIKGEIGIL